MNTTLRFATIISDDGITIYHEEFNLKEDIDEHLFSGFSSAMIAFSRELGDELTAVKMKKQTLFYQPVEDAVLIISIENGYMREEIDIRLDELINLECLSEMIKESKMGQIQSATDKFSQQLRKWFNIKTESYSRVEDIQEDEKEIFEEALKELTTFN